MGSANVILYAKWTPNTYIVTFDGAGATVGPIPSTISVTVPATTVGTLPTPPTKNGYVFLGWVNLTLEGIPFTATSPVTENFTVSANWGIRDIDGNAYSAVTIGTQVWMVQNLKTTKYNDGTSIPLVTDPTAWTLGTDEYCWYNNNAKNKTPYGALYSWYAVNTGKLAPAGWHVATDAEWAVLVAYLGGDNSAGGPLKEAGTTHWASPNAGATNSSEFSALPGGVRSGDGTFADSSGWGYWWSSTL